MVEGPAFPTHTETLPTTRPLADIQVWILAIFEESPRPKTRGNGGMNHLEQIVSEWLQYNGYFVRVSVPVGARSKGGYEGELDVVAINPGSQHLIHVECSLDAHSEEKREERFAAKFERGRRYIKDVFPGFPVSSIPEQVVVLQFSSGKIRSIGGARLVTVRELIHEIFFGLHGTSPQSKAVSSNLPLLRTLQLAADATKHRPARSPSGHHLLHPR